MNSNDIATIETKGGISNIFFVIILYLCMLIITYVLNGITSFFQFFKLNSCLKSEQLPKTKYLRKLKNY